ncbi:MAG: nucleotidyltransferase family protein [Acutalibacteraceae bacterium]|jgi:hypothetical protein
MITATQEGILTLIKSAITGEKYRLPKDFSFEEAVCIAKKHQISNILYYGAVNCGLDPNSSSMQQLLPNVYKGVTISTQQTFEIDRVLKAFEENGIDYMPLKGVLLKKMYPKDDMRLMGDADILIKTEQYDKIKPLMLNLGFTEKIESDHEFVWYNRSLYLELHKRLIPSYNKDYYAYFGDGWRLARRAEGYKCRCEMSDNDNFIYLFTHFAKHYRDAGIGIKHIVDLWVYKRDKSLDEDYLKKELTALCLYDFYLNVSHTINACFEGQPHDPKTEFLTSVIFNSGVYGTHEAHLISDALKKTKSTGSVGKTKLQKIRQIVFLPYREMCKKYPILRKCAVLLPIMWCVRWVSVLLFKRDKIKKRVKDQSLITAQSVSDYQQALIFVGLDFNFKE